MPRVLPGRILVTDLPEPKTLVAELDELARRAPSRLAERVAELTVPQQAELAIRLEPRQRMELLLHAPKPMRLVRSLPDFDWYVTVREIGPADALPLIRLASAEQMLHLFDLEAWRRDRFDGDRAGAWLAVLLESGEPALRRFLRHADEQLLALLLRFWLRVEPLEYEDGAEVHGHGLGDAGTPAGATTPDGQYRFSPTIPEHSAAAHRILQIFYVDQPERYQRAVWAARWELPAELEEEGLKWRRSRLEDRGFPAWDEAIDVYAAPGAPIGHSGLPFATDREGLAASRRALMPAWSHAKLVAAADRLDGNERERVLHEAVTVANRLLVADGADAGEPEHHRAALAKAAAYVGIALETRGADDPDSIARILGEEPIVELFREGWAQAVRLQRRAIEFLSGGWGVDHPDPLRAIDPPLDERLRALTGKRPQYVEVRENDLSGQPREFHNRAEVDETAVAIEMAARVGELLFGRLGWATGAVEEPHRLSTLFLTTLARFTSDGSWSTAPLPPGLVADFLRTVGSRRTAAPESPNRALEKLVRALAEGHQLDARDASVVQGFGRFALERLAAECGQLDPGVPPDPRYVSCLILE
ncbi:MAG: hypothetical protein GTN89_05265 [Acidobacteria bacterium]|nr:hypothetical protein [Acidobacteriota bacterium]NIM61137.1 hypothetical protein [Acidobacteriota bacterium]NIO58727.1 hypothetical protein [Acidobacteriota bacterium]NIQ29778.1 hypothetical protein [Acidobacteriota bacterium]NIQ84498.1 hypothetical protein [Acidobacteriota bacterium]